MMEDKEIRKVLSEKKKSSQISSELNISDREWRRIVKDYNSGYESRERLIVSDNSGYELTTNKKLIKSYAIRLVRHALSELSDAKKILRILSEKNQLKLIDDEADLVDIAMMIGK